LGKRSVNVRRWHFRCLHCHRISESLTFTTWPWTGKSRRQRLCQPCRCRLRIPQSGQMPIGFAAAETTQFSSSWRAIPRTLTPGPGDHFDFVCITADSNRDANTLLTTDFEEEPFQI